MKERDLFFLLLVLFLALAIALFLLNPPDSVDKVTNKTPISPEECDYCWIDEDETPVSYPLVTPVPNAPCTLR